jgi:hypothetical protein
MRVLISLLFCLIFTSSLSAQDDVTVTAAPQSKRDSLRARNVQRYPDHFFIWPVLKQRSLNFEVQSLDNRKQKLNFKPNNSFTLGLGVYLFELGIELTVALPIDDKNKYLYGETHAKDIQLNALTRKFGFDLYHQKYKGFYVSDPNNKVSKGVPYPQRSDIATRNFGLSGLYIVNDRSFSLKSAYNFAERQLHSRGSFIAVGTLNSFKLTADSSVLNQEQRSIYGEASSFKVLKYTTFSIAPGYTYNVIYRNLFLNTTLVLGPAHNWIYYKHNDNTDRNDTSINSYASVRIGLGYNSDHFFAGINFVSQSRNVKFERMSFTNSSSTFRLLFGYRFKEFGVLKKSVWDIPRALMKL